MAKKLSEELKKKIIELFIKSLDWNFIENEERIYVSEVSNYANANVLKTHYTITIANIVDDRIRLVLSYEGGTLKWVDRAYYPPTCLTEVMNSAKRYYKLFNEEFRKKVN